MLLENVGHHILHGAMHLADRKAMVASAPASRLSLSSCPGSPKSICLLMLCVSLKIEQVGAEFALRALWDSRCEWPASLSQTKNFSD